MNKKQLRFAFNKVLNAAGQARCENLHHAKKDMHPFDEDCPVEYRLSRQIYFIREHMRENDI